MDKITTKELKNHFKGKVKYYVSIIEKLNQEGKRLQHKAQERSINL